MMAAWLDSVLDVLAATSLPEQIRAADFQGLFSNPFFLLPFLALVGYFLYRRNFKGLVLLGLGIGLWVFSASSYMDGLIVNNELQLDKVLPVIGVFVLALVVLVCLFFMGG